MYKSVMNEELSFSKGAMVNEIVPRAVAGGPRMATGRDAADSVLTLTICFYRKWALPKENNSKNGITGWMLYNERTVHHLSLFKAYVLFLFKGLPSYIYICIYIDTN